MSNKSIVKVRFSLAGDEDNEKDSYVSIDSVDMFKNNKPYPGGIYDDGLGTTDYSYACSTCRNDKDACMGHDGHHRLNYPVKQPIFESDIIKWLNLICFTCGKCILPDSKVKSFNTATRFRDAYNFAKTDSRKCYWCSSIKGSDEPEVIIKSTTDIVEIIDGEKVTITDPNLRVQLSSIPIQIGYDKSVGKFGGDVDNIKILKNIHPKVRRDKANPYLYKAIYTLDKKEVVHEDDLYPHHIADIFSRVSDDTVRLFGRDPLSHPRKLILSVITVAPSAVRPDTRRFGGVRVGKNNEISTLTQYVIKKGSKIDPTFQASDPKYLSAIERLNENYHELIRGSSASKGGQAAAQKNKSLGGLLVGKKGMIRRNIEGKRVRDMGRSTVTCLPVVPLDVVGVPLSFAKTLQTTEVLQPYNKDRLMVYFNNGKDKYPGCTMIKKRNIKEPFSVENIKDDFVFEYGDTIYRDLVDGDYFLFNRQPSLHFSSMGCQKMVINKNPSASALEFNVLACPWYNADFRTLESTASVLYC